MADFNLQVAFGAAIGELKTGLNQAVSEMKNSTDQIKTALEDMKNKTDASMKGMKESVEHQTSMIKGAFNSLKTMVAEVMAAWAALSMFKGLISDAHEFTAEVVKLSNVMGISYEKATTLSIALREIGVSSDLYTAASAKLNLQIKKNESGLNDLGTVTRDANGQLLSQDELMQNGIKTMMSYEAGTSRNMVALELFKRGYIEMLPLMKLTDERMEHARKVQQEWGVEVGVGSVAQLRKYKESLADMKIGLTTVGLVLADTLMPLIKDLGKAFMTVGVPALKIFGLVLLEIKGVFIEVANVIVSFVELFINGMRALIVAVQTAGKIIFTLRFSWGSIAGDAQAGLTKLNGIVKDEMEAIKRSVYIGKHAFDEFMADYKKPEGGGPKPGGKKYTPPGEAPAGAGKETADKSRMGEWETELAQQRDFYEKMKLAQGSFEEFSKEQELKFWQDKLNNLKLSNEESNSIEKKAFDIERSLRKEAFAVELADLKNKMDSYKTGSEERIKVAKESAEKVGKAYGTESVHYKQMLHEIQKLEKEHQDQMKKLKEMGLEAQKNENLNSLNLEKERLLRMQELGQITKTEKLNALKILTLQEYAIDLQYLEDKAKLLDDDVIKQKDTFNKILDLKRKHNLEMEKLNTQLAVESKNTWSKILSPISSAFSSAIKGIIQGTTTLKDAVKNILQSILLSFIDMGIQMLTDWVAKELSMTAATATGAGTRQVLSAEEAAAGVAATKLMALGEIPPLAAVAASGAAAAMASIPYVGPVLAAAAFAETMALVLSSLSLVAAAGGYDVPDNMMAQLHAREMVLPAHLADRVRNMTEPGGKSGDFVFAPKIQALDGKDVIRVLKNNRSGLNKMFKSAVRDYHFSRA